MLGSSFSSLENRKKWKDWFSGVQKDEKLNSSTYTYQIEQIFHDDHSFLKKIIIIERLESSVRDLKWVPHGVLPHFGVVAVDFLVGKTVTSISAISCVND